MKSENVIEVLMVLSDNIRYSKIKLMVSGIVNNNQ